MLTLSSAELKTVLIVEDNRDAAETLAMLIRLKGHKALIAYDAETGLNIAHSVRPDVIIHDISLPAMSGFTAIKLLRANPELAKTVFVAYTGFAASSHRERALSAGFHHHVVKPMDFELLDHLLA